MSFNAAALAALRFSAPFSCNSHFLYGGEERRVTSPRFFNPFRELVRFSTLLLPAGSDYGAKGDLRSADQALNGKSDRRRSLVLLLRAQAVVDHGLDGWRELRLVLA